MKHRLLCVFALLFAILQTFAQTNTYEYDANNRLTKVTYSNGVTVSYTYDALGNRIGKKVTGSTGITYTISVSVNPTGSGNVTGGGTYEKGTLVELNAIPNAGYEFSKWSDGVTTNPRTITVTKNASFQAQFVQSTVISDLIGDIVVDGKVNLQDLNVLVAAYLNNTKVTQVTDLDTDGSLSIADISSLISILVENNSVNNNGHQYVDLGLPSGTLWATCNVGATAPEELGDFYAWGETETKDDYSWATYKWCDGSKPSVSNPSLTKYCDRGGYGTLDGKVTLELEDDVAHVKWGGSWHMPTRKEFQELMDYCTVEWIKLNDNLHAYRFTGSNGNSIVMPAAGEMNGTTFNEDDFNYWSSELHMKELSANNHATHVIALQYSSKTETELIGLYRYRGLAVRPVLSEYSPEVRKIDAPVSHAGHDLVDLGLPSGTLWATCNLGASSPEGYGCYYAWGETTGSCDGKTKFGVYNYPVDMTDQVEQGENLSLNNDAAAANWGGAWRMPTLSELRELINTKYTTCEWTTISGVNGYRITSIIKGFEGNSIFLPAAGYRDDNVTIDLGQKGNYWSSTLYGDHDTANNVGYVYFNSTKINWWEEEPWYGLPIRPVVSLNAIR